MLFNFWTGEMWRSKQILTLSVLSSGGPAVLRIQCVGPVIHSFIGGRSQVKDALSTSKIQHIHILIFKKRKKSWLVWLSGLGIIPQSERHQFDSQAGHMPGMQVQSLVRTHARGNQLMFPLSPSFPLSLKINFKKFI